MLVFLLFLLACCQAHAQPFAPTIGLEDHILHLHFQLPAQTYLYADRLRLTSPRHDFHVGKRLAPTPKPLGTYRVFQGAFDISFPIIDNRAQPHPCPANLHFQGCNTQGFCYPPERLALLLDLEHDRVTTLTHQPDQPPRTLWHLLSFFGFGLLLAFTPCLWPMFPILARLLWQGSRPQLSLGAAYVLGMASAYGALGAAMAWLGQNIQITLQHSWTRWGYASILAGMGIATLSEQSLLRLPRCVHEPLQRWRPDVNAPHLQAWLLGLAAALIGSPCTTPALVAALATVTHAHQTLLGMGMLFTLGLGMGLPLLILATTFAHHLPKSGPWMQGARWLLGWLLLGSALQALPPFLAQPRLLGIYLTAACTHGGWRLGWRPWIWLGIATLGGLVTLTSPSSPTQPPWPTVTTARAFEKALHTSPRPLLVAVTASWCNHCHRIRRWLDPYPLPKGWHRLRVDLSSSNGATRWLARYGVVGPPTVLVLPATKHPSLRLVGEQITEQNLQQYLASSQ